MVLLYIHTCVMIMLWHKNVLCKTGPLWEESIGRRWIYLSKGPVIRICDVFFVVNLVKLLNSCRWFEIAWRPCDVSTMVFTKNIESKEIEFPIYGKSSKEIEKVSRMTITIKIYEVQNQTSSRCKTVRTHISRVFWRRTQCLESCHF